MEQTLIEPEIDLLNLFMDVTREESGGDLISVLVKNIAKTLNCRYVFIGKVDQASEPKFVETISCWDENDFAENFVYDLKGTPCENVVRGKPCYYPTDLKNFFPEDLLAIEMNINSYIGVPLYMNGSGVKGLLVASDTKPMNVSEQFKIALNIFALRASAEIERLDILEKLEKSEARFRSIVETSNEWIWEVDLSGKINYTNKYVNDYLGYSEKELLGFDAFKVMDKDDRRKIKPRFLRLVNEKKGWKNWIIRWRHKNGGYRSLESNAVPFFDEYGQLKGFRGSARDVTERIKSEKALSESENKFRSIFEQAPIGIALIDSKTGEFQKINAHYCNIVGYTEKEMLKRNFQGITHPDDLEGDLNNMKLLIEGKIKSFVMEKRYIKKNRGIVTVVLTCIPLWQGKEDPSFHIAIVENVTDKKNKEKILEQKNAALKEILEQIEIEKESIKGNILENVESIILPQIDRLKVRSKQDVRLEVIKNCLMELTSGYGKKIHDRRIGLSTREIEICNMIKNGLVSKEIARVLGLSLQTVEKHRYNIRRKMGITNQETNLTSYLRNI